MFRGRRRIGIAGSVEAWNNRTQSLFFIFFIFDRQCCGGLQLKTLHAIGLHIAETTTTGASPDFHDPIPQMSLKHLPHNFLSFVPVSAAFGLLVPHPTFIFFNCLSLSHFIFVANLEDDFFYTRPLMPFWQSYSSPFFLFSYILKPHSNIILNPYSSSSKTTIYPLHLVLHLFSSCTTNP